MSPSPLSDPAGRGPEDRARAGGAATPPWGPGGRAGGAGGVRPTSRPCPRDDGPEYAGSRHNLGWLCLDELARRIGVTLSRKRWRSVAGSGTACGRKLWLMEPQTFMNLSGRAVREACRDLGIGADSVWVVHDEI